MKRLKAVLAVLALSTPAAAFDGLRRDLAIVPSDPTLGEPAFFYSAPDRTVDPRDAVWMSNNHSLMDALFNPGPAHDLTGVDFTAAYGVFDTGSPPSQVAIVHGAPGFAAGAPPVLEARGFAITTQDGFTVASKGDDHAISLSERTVGEPFSGSLGKSYRLAIADDFAILSFTTAQMAALTAALATPETCASCEPWRDLLDAIRAAAGPDAVLEAASGYSSTALFASRLAEAEGAELPLTNVPPYLLAMFAVTRDPGHHPTLFLSLLFPDKAIAMAGAKAGAQGMQALLDEAGGEGSPFEGATVTPGVNGAIATLVVTFDHPSGAVLGYSRWVQMVVNRSFALLSPAPRAPR